MGIPQSCTLPRNMKLAVGYCFVLLVAVASAESSVHVDEQDRTFCSISTNHACANACNGKVCTETCIASCGIFSRPFNYLCSAVAASTCTAATTAASPTASPTAASAPFTV